MNTKQIEYMLKIAEEKNVTRAAEKLFITQSALNQQLLNLEKELGTYLFHRSKANWHLTESGEIYIENAKAMMRIKEDTYRKINDLTEGKYGHLSVGFTAGRGTKMFTSAYSTFHEKYPNIYVEPKEGIVRQLQASIRQGSLDLGFMSLTESDRTEDLYETIYQEEVFLAVPSTHPIAKKASQLPGKFTTMDICEVQYEPFALMDKASTMRTLVDQIFVDAGFKPNILFETGNNQTVISMIQNNICCGLLAAYYVRSELPGITVFRLPSRPCWDFTVSYRKGSYLLEAARYFIQLIKEQWGEQPADTR